ncbi:MAG: PRC-barrel domain-containing protein [Candidatus Thermoplasmatota archaeon]|jgi:sporulation protein YlmC with PRC-barrel domain|nr:PRC-barrel domain-containing protein [Candidatus Thermoplasmatota archaeon]MCL5988541.1 PRC-barrel domain-containing protein [Candidatus Thermoplasmatota archaeon]
MKLRFNRIRGTTIGTSDGTIIGLIDDIVFDSETGRMSEVLTIPKDSRFPFLKKDQEGRYIIPFSYLKAGKDYIVMDTSKIRNLK